MKPLTATRSILFVVALYSVLKIVFSWHSARFVSAVPWLDEIETVEKDRRTRGESSLSTLKAWRAAEANLVVGRGKSMVLNIFDQHRQC
jgi:hypothetical protein